MNGNGQFGNLGAFNYGALQNPDLMRQLMQQGVPLYQPTGGSTSSTMPPSLGGFLGLLPAGGGVPGMVAKNTIMPTSMGQDWQSTPTTGSDLPSLLEQARQAYPDDSNNSQSTLKNLLNYMSNLVNRPQQPGMYTGIVPGMGTRG